MTATDCIHTQYIDYRKQIKFQKHVVCTKCEICGFF